MQIGVWWNDFVRYVWFIDWDDFDILLHIHIQFYSLFQKKKIQQINKNKAKLTILLMLTL